VHGSLHIKTEQPAFDLATAQNVVDQQNGYPSLPERLRCRIRFFTDGLILGSQFFMESHFFFFKLKLKLGYQRRHPATRLTALGLIRPVPNPVQTNASAAQRSRRAMLCS
jgi:hypothetical protein